MLSRNVRFLAIGFNYNEIDEIHSSLSEQFQLVDFNFAISVRDSLLRMNVNDYDVVFLDLTNASIDDIIRLKDVYQNHEGRMSIVTVRDTELSKISNALGMNFQYFIVKDEQYAMRLINLMQDYMSEGDRMLSLEKGFSRQTRALFQSLINTVSEHVFSIGLDYRLKLVNQGLLEKYGKVSQEVVGQHCYKFFYHFDKPCSEMNLSCPLKDVIASNQSCHVVHKLQDNIDLHLTGFPITNDYNTVVEILVAVSKKEKRKEDLFDKNLLDALVNGFSEGLLFFNSENKVLIVNRAAERMMDVEREQLIDQTVFKIPLGKGLHWLGKLLQSAKASVDVSSTIQVLVDDRPILLRFEPLYKDHTYIGGFLYVIEKVEEKRYKEIDSDILTISKFFSSKIVAEG